MTALTPSQVHAIDVPLTNLTVAYLQSPSNYVADRVFPNVPVDKQSNKFYVYDREEFNRVGDVQPLAPGVPSETVGMSLSTDNYFCNPYALAMDFDEQTLANEDSMLNIRSGGAQLLLNRMRLKREQDWISTYFATNVWDTEFDGVANADNDTTSEVTYWSDYTNSTPIEDVTEAKEDVFLASGGFMPNVMVVTMDVRNKLVNHPDILARLNGGSTVTNTALVTDSKLAEIFDVEEFMVVKAVKNTAAEGATESNSFVATKKAALYYRPPQAGLMVPASGYNFVWSPVDNDFGVQIRSYTGEHLQVQHIAEKIEAIMAYDMKVIGSEMAVFFNTIIA